MDTTSLVAIDTHTHAEVSCWNPFDNYGEEYDRAADILYINTCPPYAEQESEELGDEVIARFNPATGDIENLVDAGLRKDFLSTLFRRYLTPREQRILSLYYGLEEGSEPLTLEGIGAMLGVTRERVRQIRERAFEKLRNAPEVKHLKSLPSEAA